MEKCHLRIFFLESKKSFEIGGKCFIVSGGWSPLTTHYSTLLTSCSVLPNQSINL